MDFNHLNQREKEALFESKSHSLLISEFLDAPSSDCHCISYWSGIWLLCRSIFIEEMRTCEKGLSTPNQVRFLARIETKGWLVMTLCLSSIM